MQHVDIPWGVWHNDTPFSLEFPDNWNVEAAEMTDAPEISDDELQKSFANPIGAPRIAEMARGKSCIEKEPSASSGVPAPVPTFTPSGSLLRSPADESRESPVERAGYTAIFPSASDELRAAANRVAPNGGHWTKDERSDNPPAGWRNRSKHLVHRCPGSESGVSQIRLDPPAE